MAPNVILSFNNEDFFEEKLSFIQRLTKVSTQNYPDKLNIIEIESLFSLIKDYIVVLGLIPCLIVMVDPGLFGDVRKSNFTWNNGEAC